MSRGELTGERPVDEGMTLIEVLVGIGLFSVLGTVLLSFALSTSNVTGTIRQSVSVGEEARTGMERMTRELRQASRITAVHLPTSASDETSFTLWADFNGNGCIDRNALDPEEMTYTWDPGPKELTLTARIGSDDRTEQLLAAKVTHFSLDLMSSSWQYDHDQDGTTTWQEIDVSSVGDRNPSVFTASELQHIDLVELSITAVDASESTGSARTIDYTTRIDLRNRKQDREIQACGP